MSAIGQLTLCTAPDTLCGLAGTPHRHCVCGLPIGLDQHWCSMCLLEWFRLRSWTSSPHPGTRRLHPLIARVRSRRSRDNTF